MSIISNAVYEVYRESTSNKSKCRVHQITDILQSLNSQSRGIYAKKIFQLLLNIHF